MDEIDIAIREAIMEIAIPEMVKNTNVLAKCVNSAASSAHGSLSGAAVPGGVNVSGYTLSSTVDIHSIPRPSIFPNYAGANIFALFDQGYSVRKPVWFRNIPNFGYRAASNTIDRGVAAFKGQDSLGVTLSIVRPNGFI